MGLKQQGLQAYEAFNDEGTPLCIIPLDYSDGGLGVSLYTEDGRVTGVVVYTAEGNYDVITTAGTVPAEFTNELETRFDALTGDEIGRAGWTVMAPARGEQWNFDCLTHISRALREGTFGVQVVDGTDWAAAEEFEDYDTPCPEGTCNTCPEPEYCADLRVGNAVAEELQQAEQEVWKSNALREPLGWEAPELQRPSLLDPKQDGPFGLCCNDCGRCG
jgi:hypothetical protein